MKLLVGSICKAVSHQVHTPEPNPSTPSGVEPCPSQLTEAPSASFSLPSVASKTGFVAPFHNMVLYRHLSKMAGPSFNSDDSKLLCFLQQLCWFWVLRVLFRLVVLTSCVVFLLCTSCDCSFQAFFDCPDLCLVDLPSLVYLSLRSRHCFAVHCCTLCLCTSWFLYHAWTSFGLWISASSFCYFVGFFLDWSPCLTFPVVYILYWVNEPPALICSTRLKMTLCLFLNLQNLHFAQPFPNTRCCAWSVSLGFGGCT